MSKQYSFSVQLHDETFKVEGCHSFDEAKKEVFKAVHDRKLELSQLAPASVIGLGKKVPAEEIEEEKVINPVAEVSEK